MLLFLLLKIKKYNKHDAVIKIKEININQVTSTHF